MNSCCKTKKKDKKCKRKDGKIFNLPRRFTKKQCKKQKGFSMKSSCASYKYCKLNGGSKKSCIAKMFPDKNLSNNFVKGIVLFFQQKNNLIIDYEIKNLSDGKHGFHIHKCGDITKGCKSGCEHFNPFNKKHGSLKSDNSHAGDLGNIYSKHGIAKGKIVTSKIDIIPGSKKSIIGRMIIVHRDEDDLGLENNEESLKTGNAGERLACGIIGIKDGI